jgi:hypothetical protein
MPFKFTSEQVAALNDFHSSFPQDGKLEDVYSFIATIFRKAFSSARKAGGCGPMWDDVFIRLAEFSERKLYDAEKRHIMNRILNYYAFPGEDLYNTMYYKRLDDGTIVRDMERNMKEGRLYRKEIVALLNENAVMKKKLDLIAHIL